MTTGHVEPAVPGGECEREPGPSDSLRKIGAVVEALREHAGLSRVQFGEMIRFYAGPVRQRRPAMSDEDLESTVQARLERRRLLVECPNATFGFIVKESVFMRRLGGAEVTRILIDHVLRTVAPRNVTLQIMPADAEFHACMAGSIQLLETPDGTDSEDVSRPLRRGRGRLVALPLQQRPGRGVPRWRAFRRPTP